MASSADVPKPPEHLGERSAEGGAGPARPLPFPTPGGDPGPALDLPPDERPTAPEPIPFAPGRRPVPTLGVLRMPVVFIAHGAPVLLEDQAWRAELSDWAAAMPRPKAVLVVSAHWEQRPATLGSTQPVLPLVHDFIGFDDKYYETRYPVPGAPQLAARVRELFSARQIQQAEDPLRGLDHGAYVPLLAMYPDADVPVLQVSLPGLDPLELVALGRALSPLRDEGVLVAGSGFLTHNMEYGFGRGTPAWAREFDAWAQEALSAFDVEALIDVYGRAPAATLALPTWEHFAPILVAAGAVGESRPATHFPIRGFWRDGAFTRRSVQFD